DLAGGELRVDGAGVAEHDLALGTENELVPHLAHDLERLRRPLRIDHELADAGAVAEVDEDEAAQVTSTSDPAREDDRLVLVRRADVAAHEVAPLHAATVRVSRNQWASCGTGTSICSEPAPLLKSVTFPSATVNTARAPSLRA